MHVKLPTEHLVRSSVHGWRRGRSERLQRSSVALRSGRCPGLGIAVLVCTLLTATPPAWADYWYEHYARAETALENGNWSRAIEEVAHDRAVSFFFSVDFELLGDTERTILRYLAEQPNASLTEISRSIQDSSNAVATSLSALHELGLVARDPDGRHVIASDFLRRWLVEGTAIPPSNEK